LQPIEAIALARSAPKMYNFADRCSLTDSAMKLIFFAEANPELTIGISEMNEVLAAIWLETINWATIDRVMTTVYETVTEKKVRYAGEKSRIIQGSGNVVSLR
jgi:hypothetical protein